MFSSLNRDYHATLRHHKGGAKKRTKRKVIDAIKVIDPFPSLLSLFIMRPGGMSKKEKEAD